MASLPAPTAWLDRLPETAPPGGMAIYQLPTGTYQTRAALAVQGGSLRDKRHFAATAVLISASEGGPADRCGFWVPRC